MRQGRRAEVGHLLCGSREQFMLQPPRKSRSRPRRYEQYTQPKQRIAVRQFFDRHPSLTRRFRQRWVDELLKPIKATGHVKPIFWALVNPVSQERLAESLAYVAEHRDIGQGVSDLKSSDDDE